MKHSMVLVTAGWFVVLSLGAEPRLAWPRFHGPNGSGVADDQAPPVKLGPETNVKWKVTVPSGPSSPVIAGNKLVLTAFDRGKLYPTALGLLRPHAGVDRWVDTGLNFVLCPLELAAFGDAPEFVR